MILNEGSHVVEDYSAVYKTQQKIILFSYNSVVWDTPWNNVPQCISNHGRLIRGVSHWRGAIILRCIPQHRINFLLVEYLCQFAKEIKMESKHETWGTSWSKNQINNFMKKPSFTVFNRLSIRYWMQSLCKVNCKYSAAGFAGKCVRERLNAFTQITSGKINTL